MRFAAHVAGLDGWVRRLSSELDAAVPQVLDAAAAALRDEVDRARASVALPRAASTFVEPGRRRVGAADSVSVERERGTLATPPQPWLAPSLPAARGPMRAAAQRAVARALFQRGA